MEFRFRCNRHDPQCTCGHLIFGRMLRGSLTQPQQPHKRPYCGLTSTQPQPQPNKSHFKMDQEEAKMVRSTRWQCDPRVKQRRKWRSTGKCRMNSSWFVNTDERALPSTEPGETQRMLWYRNGIQRGNSKTLRIKLRRMLFRVQTSYLWREHSIEWRFNADVFRTLPFWPNSNCQALLSRE